MNEGMLPSIVTTPNIMMQTGRLIFININMTVPRIDTPLPLNLYIGTFVMNVKQYSKPFSNFWHELCHGTAFLTDSVQLALELVHSRQDQKQIACAKLIILPIAGFIPFLNGISAI